MKRARKSIFSLGGKEKERGKTLITAPHAGSRRYWLAGKLGVLGGADEDVRDTSALRTATLRVTSSFFSVCLSNQVNNDFIKSGEFTMERMGVTYKAKAHIRSPFDPENKRVKGVYE